MRHFQKTSFVLCLLCLATSSYAAPTRVRKANEKQLASLFLGDLRRVASVPKGAAISLYLPYEGNLLLLQYSGSKAKQRSLKIQFLDSSSREPLFTWEDDGADGTANNFQDGTASPVMYFDMPKDAPCEPPQGIQLKYQKLLLELHRYMFKMPPLPMQQASTPPDEPDRLQQRTPEEFPDSPEDESTPPLPPLLNQDDDALA